MIGRALRIAYVSCILSAAATLFPPRLVAQTPAQVAEHSKYCENVKSTLERRTSTGEYRHALTNLRSCPAALAVSVLLAQWQRPPDDTVAIRMLAETTGSFRDQRLFDIVIRTAGNSSLPRALRIATFHSLAAYADPHTVLLFRQLDRPGLDGRKYVLIGTRDHPSTEDGPMPLGADAAREVREFLANLGQRDVDPTVRAIAHFISENLEAQMPQG